MAHNDLVIKVTDNSLFVEKKIGDAVFRALEKMGLLAEAYAKLNLEKDPRRIDTGRLRNSITHTHGYDEDNNLREYIGTAVEYAVYVEYGTGVYVEDGSGRKTPWFVVGEQGKWNGVGFWTRGMKPNHFLRNAARNHDDEYVEILRKEVEDALR